jgi:DNA-binding NarL/FixJ family response regulator
MLVEDHLAFRQALASLLSQEPDLEVVAQAGSLAEARELLDSRLDVAVLDLSLPDGDGRDLIGELQRANAGISVLVLSVTIRPGRLEEVLKAGADAVLHKVASPATIVEEVRRLGGSVATPSTTTAGAGFRGLLTTAELRRIPLLGR